MARTQARARGHSGESGKGKVSLNSCHSGLTNESGEAKPQGPTHGREGRGLQEVFEVDHRPLSQSGDGLQFRQLLAGFEDALSGAEGPVYG